MNNRQEYIWGRQGLGRWIKKGIFYSIDLIILIFFVVIYCLVYSRYIINDYGMGQNLDFFVVFIK